MTGPYVGWGSRQCFSREHGGMKKWWWSLYFYARRVLICLTEEGRTYELPPNILTWVTAEAKWAHFILPAVSKCIPEDRVISRGGALLFLCHACFHSLFSQLKTSHFPGDSSAQRLQSFLCFVVVSTSPFFQAWSTVATGLNPAHVLKIKLFFWHLKA